MSGQQTLPLTGRGLCGYCLHPLEAAGEVAGQTYYECPRCKPCFAGIATVEDWKAFAKSAWKRRRRG